MLNTFSAKVYNKIRNTEGNTFVDNTNVLHNPVMMRKTKVLPANDILSAGYSLHNFASDVKKGAKVVNDVVPQSVKDEIKRQAMNAITNYVAPAATIAAEDAPLALLAAGRKIAKAKKANKKLNNHLEEEGAGIKGLRPSGTMLWTEHVKKYRAQHGGTYKEALLAASESYKKVKKAHTGLVESVKKMKPLRIKK